MDTASISKHLYTKQLQNMEPIFEQIKNIDGISPKQADEMIAVMKTSKANQILMVVEKFAKLIGDYHYFPDSVVIETCEHLLDEKNEIKDDEDTVQNIINLLFDAYKKTPEYTIAIRKHRKMFSLSCNIPQDSKLCMKMYKTYRDSEMPYNDDFIKKPIEEINKLCTTYLIARDHLVAIGHFDNVDDDFVDNVVVRCVTLDKFDKNSIIQVVMDLIAK